MQVRSRRARRVIWLTVVIVCVSRSAHAADRFVSTAGSDGANDCASSGAPCRTVAHGLAQAGSGDTVKVAGGSYVESLLIDFPITLTLSGGWAPDFASRDLAKHRTKLAHSEQDIRADGGETIAVDFDGLEFPSGEIDVQGTLDGAVHVTVTDCRFSRWTLRASHGGTGTLDLTVARSTFTGSDRQVPLNLFVLAGGSSTVNVTVQASSFTTSRVGSIVLATFDTATSSLSIDGSVFLRNASTPISVDNRATSSVVVTNSFVARSTQATAGAIMISGSSGAQTSATFVNDTIVRNKAVADTGACHGGGGVVGVAQVNQSAVGLVGFFGQLAHVPCVILAQLGKHDGAP